MTDKGVEAFIEAILTDQAPKPFRAGYEDTAVLRVAVELRASQPGVAVLDPKFVEELHRRLATIANDGARMLPISMGEWRPSNNERRIPWTRSRSCPRRTGRRRFGIVIQAMAAVLLVVGTVIATNLVSRNGPASEDERTSSAIVIRSGELLTADGRPLGWAYAYNGNLVWIFMEVHAGAHTCKLELANGMVLAAGTVVVHNGSGLERVGYIKFGDTDRLGTRYTVLLPREVPSVREQLVAAENVLPKQADYYNEPQLRLSLFERDKWHLPLLR